MRHPDSMLGTSATVPLAAADPGPGDLVLRLPKAGVAIVSRVRTIYEAQFHAPRERGGRALPPKRGGAAPGGVRAL